MDIVLSLADDYVLDHVWARIVPGTHTSSYPISHAVSQFNESSVFSHPFLSKWPVVPPPVPSAWPRDYLLRQAASLTVITMIGILIFYFLFAGLSYYFIFNHDMMRHPRFLPHQVRQEIVTSLWAFPGMTALMLPLFLLETRGYSRLYTNVDDYGILYLVASVPL